MESYCKFNKTLSELQENSIAKEFKRTKDDIYLDHAGATLYSEQQLQNVFLDLSNNIFANPHARNLSSKLCEDAIDIVRFQILQHFNTNFEEYSLIFTKGATEALKTVAECFGYRSDQGIFAYLENNHTSVLGMRCYANNLREVKTEDAFQTLSNYPENYPRTTTKISNSLFVYPAQCNFSGTKYPLEWIDRVQKGALNTLFGEIDQKWYVVLDAAGYVGTNLLDLSKYKPDFVSISFYKIFGYPTGLGCLLVKKTSEDMLEKQYLGGGTVLMALSSQNVMVPRPLLHERFEDGTLSFLSIVALKYGFDTIKRLNLNFDLISKHVFSLSQYVYKNLQVLHHSNGKPLAIFYHDTIFENKDHQGGIINFNLIRPNGEYIGYSEVLHFANLYKIHLRTGCSCNPGACQRFLALSAEDVKKHFDAGHICGDQHDLVDGYPTGSVRISFGYMSTKGDADGFLNMVENCFVSKPVIKKIPRNYENLKKKYQQLFHSNQKYLDGVGVTNKNCKKDVDVGDYCTKCKNNSINTNVVEIENINIPQNGIKGSKDECIGVLKQIVLYPIKSCGGFYVSKNWPLTLTGLKYDRLWMIVSSSGVCYSQKHNKKLCLIKPFVDLQRRMLRLTFEGRNDTELPLDEELSEKNEGFPCQSKVCGDHIQGWDCGNRIATWLSTVLETPGLRLLRQCSDSDEKSGRVSKASHNEKLSFANKAQYLLVNSSSAQWLKDRVPDDDFDESLNSVIKRFRPNFVVNFSEPFEENDYNEFLIDDLTFIFSGKCTRCQMICIDQNTGETSKEPLLSLSREFKGKISFGVYLKESNFVEGRTMAIGAKVLGRK